MSQEPDQNPAERSGGAGSPAESGAGRPAEQGRDGDRPAGYASAPNQVGSSDGAQPSDSTWGQAALNAERHGGTWIRPVDESTISGAGGSGSGGIGAGFEGDALGGHGVAGGRGAPLGRSPSRRMGPKPIRAPRFSGSPLIAGLGLLSLLITVLIMALLATKVLGGVGSSGPAESRVVEQLGPGSGEIEGGLTDSDPTGTDAAQAGTCKAEKAVIETAAVAYSVTVGSDATSIDDLVSEGLLKEGTHNFEIESGPSGFEIIGKGLCEGT